MDKLVIEGGYPLFGEVEISGSKNSSLPILAACILATDKCILHNVPNVKDIEHMSLVLETLGLKVERVAEHSLCIDPTGLKNYEAPYDLVRKMRASVYVLGALLGKLRKARVSLPGGCAIGVRPIDLHIKGLESLGANIQIESGYINAVAHKIKGTDIYLDFPSVGATVNIMLTAVVAEGITKIENAAKEPEIEDLARFLNKMGAKISGAGTETIIIEGVPKLYNAEYEIIPDRIEAGTYIIAGAITNGKIEVKKVIPEHLQTLENKLIEAGVNIKVAESTILVDGTNKRHAVDITTLPYPGFPTDLQAQFMALMSVTEGTSVITETIWENRFMHVAELTRMGAKIKLEGNSAIVTGVPYLSGAPVMASDLRASAALVLAGLVAKGKTIVNRIYHLDRGYESIEKKLTQLGAHIKRIS